MPGRVIRWVGAAVLVLGLGSGSILGAQAQGAVDYGRLEAVMEAHFATALDRYGKGDAEGARRAVQDAYFQAFEHLERPLRIHASARTSEEMEKEFGAIRSLITDGAPLATVRGRMEAISGELKSRLPGPGSPPAPKAGGAEGGSAPSPGQASYDPRKAGPEEASVPKTAEDWGQVNSRLFATLDHARDLYRQGQAQAAIALVQGAYFDSFEGSGMEARVGSRNSDLKTELEGHFSRLTALMKAGAPEAELNAYLGTMRQDFDQAAALLVQGQDQPAALFVYSLTIILREGLEALLVISAILTCLVKAGHRERLRTVYGGCLTALGLSLVTAVAMKGVLRSVPASQGVLEGATMLLAAAVLFAVSYWLVSKAEAQKWNAYIQGKVGDSLSANSAKALWFAAFLAVYREGAETVLFYQALLAGTSSGAGLTAVAAGFAAGCLLLALLYLAMRYGAVRLPLRPFFLATGGLLYAMAFVFAGNGVMELAEGKVLGTTLVPWVPTLPFLGIHPYVQSLVPQALIVLAAVVAFLYLARRRRRTVPAV